MLGFNATNAINLLEIDLVRRLFSIELINVSSPNFIKSMSYKLLINVQSEIRLLTRIQPSGSGPIFTAPFKYSCSAFNAARMC